MDETREFPLLGWWIIGGFAGAVLSLGLLGWLYHIGSPIDVRFIFVPAICVFLMAIGRKAIVNRQEKTFSIQYGLLGRYPLHFRNRGHFDFAYLRLNRTYSKGVVITYRTGVVCKSRRVEIDWQTLKFPSEVPSNVMEFIFWLNLPTQLEGEYQTYATEEVRHEVSKLTIINSA